MNDIPPIQDPKNNYCLSYEGKEKADVLNKYFCSITNHQSKHDQALYFCQNINNTIIPYIRILDFDWLIVRVLFVYFHI
jgi:hypothetical protein